LFSLYAGTGIYKFGNNTYPRRIRCRSNLGHISRGKKCVLWAGKYDNIIVLLLQFKHLQTKPFLIETNVSLLKTSHITNIKTMYMSKAKMSLCLTKHDNMKVYGRQEV